MADASGAPRQWWFGGGTDFTPAYIFEEDVRHFHQVNFAPQPKFVILFPLHSILSYKLCGVARSRKLLLHSKTRLKVNIGPVAHREYRLLQIWGRNPNRCHWPCPIRCPGARLELLKIL